MRTCPFAGFVPNNGLMHRSKEHTLFDHLVGEREQFRRNFEAECLCCGEINDEIEFGRLLDWDVARLRAA
jgi:hypothetical protein